MFFGLLVKKGPHMGENFLLNDTSPVEGGHFAINDGITTIGRGIENDIQLNDPKVSRSHCQIAKDKNTFLIRDLNSQNHIMVNGKTVSELVLEMGDEITVGDSTLVFTPRSDLPPDKSFVESRKALEGVLHSSTIKIPHNERARIFDSEELKSDLPKYKKAHNNLLTLYKIGNAVNSIRDLPILFRTIMDIIFDVISADRGVLMTCSPDSGEMIPRAVKRKNEPTKADEKLPISRTLIRHILEKREAILSRDALDDSRFNTKESIAQQSVRSFMCAPVMSKEELIGLIYLDCNRDTNKFEETDLEFLLAIAGQAGIAIENSRLFEDLHALFLDTIKTLVAMIDAKDNYTRGHSERVSTISLMIAEEMRLSKMEVESIRLTSLLHDIGKIWVSGDILNKTSTLSPEERIHIEKHPETGAKIISNIKNLDNVVLGIRHHHERFDGGGYPDGLFGKDIPLIARILSVADTFDAMLSNRPYRDSHTQKETLLELKKCSGTQFDPEVIDAFIKAVEESPIVYPDIIPDEASSYQK